LGQGSTGASWARRNWINSRCALPVACVAIHSYISTWQGTGVVRKGHRGCGPLSPPSQMTQVAQPGRPRTLNWVGSPPRTPVRHCVCLICTQCPVPCRGASGGRRAAGCLEGVAVSASPRRPSPEGARQSPLQRSKGACASADLAGSAAAGVGRCACCPRKAPGPPLALAGQPEQNDSSRGRRAGVISSTPPPGIFSQLVETGFSVSSSTKRNNKT